MFELEAEIREDNLSDDAIMNKRLVELKPLIEEFFDWLSKTCKERTLSPTSHFMKAVRYAERRKADMLVALTKPRVPLDSNEVERLQRPVAVGRKNRDVLLDRERRQGLHHITIACHDMPHQ